MIQFRAAALTDIGRVRRQNEDRWLLDESAMIFGVADGVGGLPGGAEAAQKTVDEVRSQLKQLCRDGKKPNLESVVLRANEHVTIMGAKISPNMGIGSTLTFGQVCEKTLCLAHVGDSRCYALRGGTLELLTMDHSVENEARQKRERGEVVYYHEASRHALTRCMGQPVPLEVDVTVRALEGGDRYLFCTDGITRMVQDEELAAIMSQAHEPEEILREIITLAVRRGGPDNATGVMLIVDSLE